MSTYHTYVHIHTNIMFTSYAWEVSLENFLAFSYYCNLLQLFSVWEDSGQRKIDKIVNYR